MSNKWLRENDTLSSPAEIHQWLGNAEAWPTADSYDLDTLTPCPRLAHREQVLKNQLPSWFWEGEADATILSIGTGKGYFERKYWKNFSQILCIDPSNNTCHSLKHFPVSNVQLLARSLYDAPFHLSPTPKYGWIGAAVHYLFGEFYGWSFMQKLAMMISDTLVIDAGVFDAESPQGKFLMSQWVAEDNPATEPFEFQRQRDFSWQAFCQRTGDLWEIAFEASTQWIDDGRRNVILKRKLPPTIQKSQLVDRQLLIDRQDKWRDNWTIWRTAEGYYKETPHITPLLVYDTVSKMMGWDQMIKYAVYDDEQFAGFVVRDYGEIRPDDCVVSERLYVQLINALLPLGMMPADVACDNIRLSQDAPVWIDVELMGLCDYNPFLAIWSVTNTYKQYEQIPDRANPANRLARQMMPEG